MNNFECDRSSWGDQQLDVLLTDFFLNELPEELRDLPSGSEVSSTTSMVTRRKRTAFAPVIGLTVVAATLLLAVLVVWSPSANRPEQPSHRLVGNTAFAVRPLPERSVDDKPPVEIPLESLMIERYETASGPVEQRTNVRWTNVSVFEPESGAEVEVMIPELSIEIFEINDK